MPAVSGRTLLIKKAATAIAGFRTNTISVDGSPVDITDKGDAGFQTMADFAGRKSIELSGDGVWKANTLSAIGMAGVATGHLLTDITMVNGNGDTIDGDFYLSSYEETGADDGAVEFSATLQSSGAWVLTPAT
jgi:TP901-1 family phage major tail protein